MITPNRNGKYGLEFVFNEILGLLICTVISENQVLEKSISASNLRKFSGPANLDFYTLNLKKIQVTNWKKIQVCRTWNFSKVWNRHWFSEIKVQIKRPPVKIPIWYKNTVKIKQSNPILFSWTTKTRFWQGIWSSLECYCWRMLLLWYWLWFPLYILFLVWTSGHIGLAGKFSLF